MNNRGNVLFEGFCWCQKLLNIKRLFLILVIGFIAINFVSLLIELWLKMMLICCMRLKWWAFLFWTYFLLWMIASGICIYFLCNRNKLLSLTHRLILWRYRLLMWLMMWLMMGNLQMHHGLGNMTILLFNG